MGNGLLGNLGIWALRELNKGRREEMGDLLRERLFVGLAVLCSGFKTLAPCSCITLLRQRLKVDGLLEKGQCLQASTRRRSLRLPERIKTNVSGSRVLDFVLNQGTQRFEGTRVCSWLRTVKRISSHNFALSLCTNFATASWKCYYGDQAPSRIVLVQMQPALSRRTGLDFPTCCQSLED